MGGQQRADQGDGHAGVVLDGVLGGVVTRNGGAEDEPPLVRMRRSTELPVSPAIGATK